MPAPVRPSLGGSDDWQHQGVRCKSCPRSILEELTQVDWSPAEAFSVSRFNDAIRIYHTTQHDGIDFNLGYIGFDFNKKLPAPFDQDYMQALFDCGYQRALRGYDWSKQPPG
jgi:hypothetical protein